MPVRAVNRRLDIIMRKQEAGLELEKEHKAGMMKLMTNWYEFKMSYERKVDQFSNREWKMVEKIPFNDLHSRWIDVCSELAVLGEQKLFVYD